MVDEIRDSFMSMFKMVDPNGKYLPAKIAGFYYMIGEALVYHPIKNIMGDIDMRYSHAICITSGRGKDPIKNVAYVTAEALGMKYEEFTSLHEEQLIGKKWKDKDTKEIKEVKGYFGDDFIEKDDGLPFINSDKYEIARNYWLRCLNVYGKNLISKRLTEMPEGLKYLGTASLRYFIQTSEHIKTKNLTSGLFRRCPIIRIDLTRQEIKEIKDLRLRMKFNPNTEPFYNFIRNIRNIRNIRYINIGDSLIDIINKECDMESNNVLLDSLDIENQNIIVKWSYINAIIKLYRLNSLNSLNSLDVKIDEEDVRKAIEDYRIVYGGIKNFVLGNEVSNEIQKAIIGFIKISKEKLSSPEVFKGVSEILGIPEATTRSHFYKLKKMGFINTKQITKWIDGVLNTTSEVWI